MEYTKSNDGVDLEAKTWRVILFGISNQHPPIAGLGLTPVRSGDWGGCQECIHESILFQLLFAEQRFV